MNLLFAIKTLKTVKGGAERVFSDLVSAMANRGHKVTIITFDSDEGLPLYHLDPEIRQIYLGLGDAGLATGISVFLKRLPALRRAIRGAQPDIVIGFTHAMYVPLSLAMLGSRIPLVASEHIVPDYYGKRRLEYMLLRLSSYLVDRFTVLSRNVGELYPESVRSKMFVLPNSVDEAHKFADPQGDQVNPKIILNVGRLVDFKDQETLIRAFASIANDNPEWNLRIIGEGELRQRLESVISSLGLIERVQLHGVSEDIESEYIHAHIFALSSIYEGFGLVTAEAASHGLPCVGFSDCTGTNELIEHEFNGLLVDSENRVAGMASALQVLINDPGYRCLLGKNGISKMKRYSPEKIYDLWEEALEGLC